MFQIYNMLKTFVNFISYVEVKNDMFHTKTHYGGSAPFSKAGISNVLFNVLEMSS